jgi:hypothetical protein
VLLGLSILRGESRASSVWSATSPEQAKLALRVRDSQGRPIEARVRVAPSDWAERVRLGSFGDLHRTLDVSGAENAFPLRHLPRWRRTTPEALFAEL